MVLLVSASSELSFLQSELGSADLAEVFPNQVSEVVYVSRKRVTRRLHVSVFGCGLVATAQWLFKRRSLGGVVLARKAKVDEKISRRAPGSCVCFRLSTKVLATLYARGME